MGKAEPFVLPIGFMSITGGAKPNRHYRNSKVIWTWKIEELHASCYYCLSASKQEIGFGHVARRKPPTMMLVFLACLLAVLPGLSAQSQPTPCRI